MRELAKVKISLILITYKHHKVRMYPIQALDTHSGDLSIITPLHLFV